MQHLHINKNVIIYTRSSTQNQNLNNAASLETQNHSCNKYCIDNHLEINQTISEICSARKSIKQIQLNNLIENNKNIILIIFDITRFSRNIIDGCIMLHKCVDNNIELHFVRENVIIKIQLDLNKIMPFLLQSQYESDTISYRSKQSIEYRRSIGSHIGKAKYGFDIIKENNIRKLVVNEEEKKVVDLILALKFGSSLKNINHIFKLNFNHDDSIVMYGNYENSDIVHILNKNNILRRNLHWTVNNILTIVNQNQEIIIEKEELTEQLIIELLKFKSNDKITKYYKQLNGYNIPNNFVPMNIYQILIFLNNNQVNFRVWTIEDIEHLFVDNKKIKLNY